MTERYKTRKNIQIIIVVLLLFLVVGYTLYEIQRVISGPKITVYYPQNGAILSTSTLEISGTTKNINDISLDDRKIYIDEKGNFKEEMLLSPGYNTIMLEAHDRFQSETNKIIEVIYQKP